MSKILVLFYFPGQKVSTSTSGNIATLSLQVFYKIA